jgi:hypothetical protein
MQVRVQSQAQVQKQVLMMQERPIQKMRQRPKNAPVSARMERRTGVPASLSWNRADNTADIQTDHQRLLLKKECSARNFDDIHSIGTAVQRAPAAYQGGGLDRTCGVGPSQLMDPMPQMVV